MEYKNPQVLFHGSRIDVLSIDTERGPREIVDHPGAVVILPFLDPDTILLIKNDRPVVQEKLLELPAGTLEQGEEPLTCAARELEEETGYKAAHIEPLFSCYSTPGFCNEKLFFFLAKDLTHVGQNLDPTEEIEVVPTKFTRALEMIKSGEVHDAKTSLGLLACT